MAVYDQHGISFHYPDEWTLEEQAQEDQLTITIDSEGTSFWSLTLMFSEPDPEELLEAVIAAFKEEYEELDVYNSSAAQSIEGAVSRELEFVCLELINSAHLCAIPTPLYTALVMFQGTDFELEETRSMLEDICTSLEFLIDAEDLYT